MRQEGIDTRALVCGIVLSGVLGVGFATALLYLSRSSNDPHVGPTAASLDDGLSTFFGAALGLALASVLVAAFARRARVLNAILASLVAYLVVLVPLLLATRPYDVGVGETLSTAVGLGVLVLPVVAVAAACGAGAGHVLRGRRA